MSDLHLRDATLDDAALITGLVMAGFEEYRETLVPPSGAHSETPEKIRAKLEQGGGIIASLDKTPVGCVVYYPEDVDQLYFGRLSVLPAYRKLGVARALVAAVEEKALANEYPRVSLSVRVGRPVPCVF